MHVQIQQTFGETVDNLKTSSHNPSTIMAMMEHRSTPCSMVAQGELTQHFEGESK
jgi:hypothetical protein